MKACAKKGFYNFSEHQLLLLCSNPQNMAGPLFSARLIVLVEHLCLLHHIHAGAFYRHQPLPQQHHPLPQLPLMQHGNEGIPQHHYYGKEMPQLSYGNEMPLLPHYGKGKERPQIPMHLGKPNIGKGRFKKLLRNAFIY